MLQVIAEVATQVVTDRDGRGGRQGGSDQWRLVEAGERSHVGVGVDHGAL